MQPIDKGLSPSVIFENISPGDEIIIITRNKEKHKVVVDSVTMKEIVGSNKTIKTSEIIAIEKEGVDALKTTGAIVGGYLIYGVIASLIFLAAL